MEFLTKFFKVFKIAVFIGVAIAIYYGLTTPEEVKFERHLKSIQKKDYRGVVLKKYIDKSEHSRPILVLTNRKEVSIKNEAYDKIKLKDSIIKRKGDLYLTVYRNNDNHTIKLD